MPAAAVRHLGFRVTGTDTAVGKTLVAAALLLARESSARWPYELVNPCLYADPVGPHLAAAAAGRPIDIERIAAAFATLAAGSDIVIVEGAGGWRVPLGDGRTVGQLASRLGLPVILVVGLRLGCLNHALLTTEAVRAEGSPAGSATASTPRSRSSRRTWRRCGRCCRRPALASSRRCRAPTPTPPRGASTSDPCSPAERAPAAAQVIVFAGVATRRAGSSASAEGRCFPGNGWRLHCAARTAPSRADSARVARPAAGAGAIPTEEQRRTMGQCLAALIGRTDTSPLARTAGRIGRCAPAGRAGRTQDRVRGFDVEP